MPVLAPIEEVFHRINNFTTLKSCHKRKTAHNFDQIRDYILDRMRNEDEVFDYITNGHCLTGSYADNLKVKLPNEFDLLILFKFNFTPKVEVDADRPGNVKINMNDTLEKFEENPNTYFAYTALTEMCNSEGYLLHGEFQSWIQGIIAKINLQGVTLELNGQRYSIRYTTSGPAHTIHVVTDPVAFDIDLVPALLLDVKSWCAPRPCPWKARERYWHAIPKPIYINDGLIDKSSVSWQGSYANIERVLIDNCNNLKNTLRMLKKLRDRQNYGTFKSYYIKTMYLWECSKQEKVFWNQPIETIIFHMIKKWIEYLENRYLPFYWDKGCNLLKGKNCSTMLCQLKFVYKRLCECRQGDPEGILKYFLTEAEILQLYGSDADFIHTDTIRQSTDPDKDKSSNRSLFWKIIDGIKNLIFS